MSSLHLCLNMQSIKIIICTLEGKSMLVLINDAARLH